MIKTIYGHGSHHGHDTLTIYMIFGLFSQEDSTLIDQAVSGKKKFKNGHIREHVYSLATGEDNSSVSKLFYIHKSSVNKVFCCKFLAL